MRNVNAYPRGYTLIELAMVLVITGTLAAMAIPRYTTAISNYRADVAANQIVADLNYARTRAAASSSPRVVSFSLAGGTYSISGEKDLSHPALGYITDLTSRPYFASLATVNFAGSTSISFNGFGIPANAGSVSIRVGPTTRNIILSADSGIASVQ